MGSGQVQGGNAQEGRRHYREEVRNDALQQSVRVPLAVQQKKGPRLWQVRPAKIQGFCGILAEFGSPRPWPSIVHCNIRNRESGEIASRLALRAVG
jgi:hypothetical protein